MASAGQVDVKVAVKPKVAIGTSTVAGGTVSLVAFALALVAFWQGARDEATISALVVGLVSLVTVLGGRYAQAVAALAVTARRPAPVPLSQPMTAASSGTAASVAWTSPRPGAEMSNVVTEPVEPGDPDALPDYETAEDVPPDVGDEHARPEGPEEYA